MRLASTANSLSRVVLLDAEPLGLVTHPRAERNRETVLWLRSLLNVGVFIRAPEIADYEVRRELLRAGKTKGVARLDQLASEIGYLPITTEVMRLAARFWADARLQGRPAASDDSLDADMILSAQAVLAEEEGANEVVVATTNLRHLSLFTNAKYWWEIIP